MALAFFGTPSFAVPSLDALIKAGEQVSCVVTQPDRVKGRGHVVSAPPVKDLALSSGLPVLQPRRMKDEEFLRSLGGAAPEFIVVVAFGRILPPEVLAIPERGCINVHASLLPKYRGAAPIQWALLNGEKVTGVTTMLMDEGLDTGDILIRSEIVIGDDDNADTLSRKLSSLGGEVLLDTIRGVRTGGVRPVPQQGPPSYAPPLKKDDGRIIWTRSAEELANLVRAMYPWPSAFCRIGGERLRVVKASALEGAGLPGRVEKASKGELIVGTGRGVLRIEVLQPEGRRMMSAAAFLAGRKLREGNEELA